MVLKRVCLEIQGKNATDACPKGKRIGLRKERKKGLETARGQKQRDLVI